ncbi:MAG: DUF1653 domain-containing protein [Pseudomonadota bacterium]|nr:DUF1653 domain-containing protein [Pseudomonadota bacterium]
MNQLFSFNLYALGIYKRFDGVDVALNSLALHSETGEIYAVLSDVPDNSNNEEGEYILPSKFYVEKLALFGDPNFQGKGPRHALHQEIMSHTSVRFLSDDGVEPGVYGHYKSEANGGREYDVYGTVQSDEGAFVLYRPCYGTRPMMIRPLAMFIEEVDEAGYNYKGPRFYKLRGF